MKTILILRHAKSSWDNLQLSDYDRPLKKRGKRDAPRMGKLLLDEGLLPQLIISSSAKRALSTADLVANACDYLGEVSMTRSFYHADPETYLRYLNKIDNDLQIVLIVGHNPGVEDLVSTFAGHYERMPTAALAQVELLIDSWLQLDSTTPSKLVNLWRPKELTY
jgi:phosphohistidine phosphatase